MKTGNVFKDASDEAIIYGLCMMDIIDDIEAFELAVLLLLYFKEHHLAYRMNVGKDAWTWEEILSDKEYRMKVYCCWVLCASSDALALFKDYADKFFLATVNSIRNDIKETKNANSNGGT